MSYSHRAGCPLPLRNLRYLRMRYIDFEGSALDWGGWEASAAIGVSVSENVNFLHNPVS